MAQQSLDLTDTKIAFANKTDEQLKKTAWLFSMMNRPWLVRVGGWLAGKSVQWGLPMADRAVKNTIFEQFCGGTTLLECRTVIENLKEYNCMTVLDYGAEGKETEEDFNVTMNELLRTIDFAAERDSVPMVSTKVTGLARNALLEKAADLNALNPEELEEYEHVLKRLDAVCKRAADVGVGLFVDAEETWMQDAIDRMVMQMMERYNKDEVVVYHTYQLYRKDKLEHLKEDYKVAREKGFLLGAKLVRGAYMDKERERAVERGYPSPIQETREDTDKAYNAALSFCVGHYEDVALCNASHNLKSNRLMADWIEERDLPKNHPHLNFCQLYGMSDYITFNLANADYYVAKYVPFGPVKEVIPYLMRRAEENTAVTDEMSREYRIVKEEMKRRGIA